MSTTVGHLKAWLEELPEDMEVRIKAFDVDKGIIVLVPITEYESVQKRDGEGQLYTVGPVTLGVVRL